jgi:type 1 glutamine amidotransferase
MPQPQPVMWRHQHTGGRVVYDALGHDHESLLQPDHANALREMVRWALTSEETL